MTEREPMPWTGQEWMPADVQHVPSREWIEEQERLLAEVDDEDA